MFASDLVRACYVRDPNRENGWYAGGPGVYQPATPLTNIEDCGDRLRIYEDVFFGEPYTKHSFWDRRTLAVFESVDEMLAWLREHGRPSEGGMPAGSIHNVWD